jgi:hypothetical protein
VGGASTLWQKNPLIMLLEAPSHSISPDAVRVGDNGVIYRQWTFSFFFSLLPQNYMLFFLLLIFQLVLFFWFLIFILGSL